MALPGTALHLIQSNKSTAHVFNLRISTPINNTFFLLFVLDHCRCKYRDHHAELQ